MMYLCANSFYSEGAAGKRVCSVTTKLSNVITHSDMKGSTITMNEDRAPLPTTIVILVNVLETIVTAVATTTVTTTAVTTTDVTTTAVTTTAATTAVTIFAVTTTVVVIEAGPDPMIEARPELTILPEMKMQQTDDLTRGRNILFMLIDAIM
jgi:hypothetical protein